MTRRRKIITVTAAAVTLPATRTATAAVLTGGDTEDAEPTSKPTTSQRPTATTTPTPKPTATPTSTPTPVATDAPATPTTPEGQDTGGTGSGGDAPSAPPGTSNPSPQPPAPPAPEPPAPPQPPALVPATMVTNSAYLASCERGGLIASRDVGSGGSWAPSETQPWTYDRTSDTSFSIYRCITDW